MPASDKARFEPKEIVSSQDFAVRENKDRSTAQANETFVLDAKSNRSIGENGETLAFGKKQFGFDQAVEQARMDAQTAAQTELAGMLANPAVRTWNDQKVHVENLDSQLKFATQAMEVANEALEKGITDGVTGDDLAALQSDAQRRTAAVTQLQRDKQNAPDTLKRLAGELQQNPDLQAFVRQQQKVEAAKNLVGSSNAIAESSANLYAGNSMYDPAEGGDRDLITRSVASAKVDQLLGTNVCAQEKFGLDDQGKLIGVSVQADGAGVRSQTGENEWMEQQTAFLNVDYSKSEIQRGLYDLEALDYVTGQIDRHQGNIFIDGKSGKVTGIDNDLAFPAVDREQMLNRNEGLKDKAVAGMPKMMHEETAAKLMSVTPEQLRETLQGIKAPDTGKSLGEAEIEGAIKRLQDLQTAISNAPAGGIKIVPEFTPDTYAESIAIQEENNRQQSLSRDANSTKEVKFDSTSYIGSVENERQFAQAKIDAGDSLYKMRDENSAGKAKINQEFAAYQEMDAGGKAQYKAFQKDIDKLEDKLAATRQEIQKLEGTSSSLKNNLANIRHGGVEGTLKHLVKKEAEITQQLRAKTDAAGKLTEPIITEKIAKENALIASSQAVNQGRGQEHPPIEQRVPLNQLPPPVRKVGEAGNGVPPIEQRVPLNQLPPPAGNLGPAGNGVPPIEARTPLQSLPPPVGVDNSKVTKTNIPAKDKGAGDGLKASEVELEAANGLDGNSPREGLENQEQKKKPSVAEMLKRTQSSPELGGHRQGQDQAQGQDGEKPKANSLRASGEWQPVKPSAPKPGGSSLTRSQ